MLSHGINDNKAMAEDSSASQAEENKARERAKRQIEERVDLQKELDQLKKGVYQPGQSIPLQEFQQRDEVRQEREQEIQRERQEQEKIKKDENRPSAEREHGRERIEELDLEQNEIENERERETEQLSLRDRLREKVKAIFKKYDFTVTAVSLAVCTTSSQTA